MKAFIAALALASAFALPACCEQEDEDFEQPSSTWTAVADPEEEQAQLQASDEDIVQFVADYVKKDSQLKGAFLLEDVKTKRLLKLTLKTPPRITGGGKEGVKLVTAAFTNAAGATYTVRFHVQTASWGSLDISKIELMPGVLPGGPK